MKKLFCIFFSVLLCQLSIYGQKETSWWHFGFNSGLNFNSLSDATASDATVVSNMPQPIVGALSTFEGCFTVSTYDGRFLFSSDGVTVYDKNYNPMPNGTGLMGNPSATQSGIVIPRPGSLTQYYVVTVPSLDAPTLGIRYSIVDMTLNGGLGNVVSASKNTIIKSGTVSENIAAVPNNNDEDYWLIHRTGETFYVFPVTAEGISSTPHQTISAAGININYGASLGELIISSDYSKILSCNWSGKQIISADFNPTTGLISNIQALGIPSAEVTYAACFSPDNSYVYVTTGYYTARVYSNTWTSLRSGVVPALLGYGPSNIKPGIDGRLYGIKSPGPNTNPATAGTKDLYVIMNPNDGGTVMKYFPDYLINNAYLGLPSFPAGFIRVIPKSKPFACVAHSRTYGVEIDLSGGNAPVRLEWNFGDGTAVVNQTVNLTQTEYTVQHTYPNAGIYTVVVTPYKADGTKAKLITMEANIVYCNLKSNTMTRSELLNSKQLP